ncbi:hypothetical protein [Bosea sp. (in: a-proteobacteria)]|uniref:hypothetical protein n=1 Tax=Bosea sp. (in: a-proteobacteria) TaxID=1871050 RepID=UPI0027359B85|nr:hypothetical protein [Bosea sp. (in: a-proteobacteria)]MDP3411225.1 hypothetical protein [Bosea sp. (in: a-proteobacteria)]
MNKLIVTFEIEWTDETTYNSIYEKLNAAIKSGLGAPDWWSETTSFYIVQTKENSSGFAARVWNAAGMRKSRDRLVVLNMNGEGGAAVGLIKDQTIFSLLPVVKNLSKPESGRQAYWKHNEEF